MAPPKGNPATIRDVALKAGVAVGTVSRVLNGSGPVSPETEARVRAVMAELDYVPLASAQNLSNRRTNVLGFVLPVIGWDNFFPPMFRGVEAACYEGGYDLLIHSTYHDLPPGRPERKPVGEHNTDGLLVFTSALTDEEIIRLHGSGFPLVLLHRTPPSGLVIPRVVFENRNGSRQVVDHLIEVHGYRRIGFLAGQEGNDDARWRERGYRESLDAHGIHFDSSLVRRGGFSREVAEKAVATWIEEGLDIDALFAADDDSAYGAIQALRSAGRRVPEDVPVVGFDDSPSSSLLTPPLTTVAAPIEEAGYRAASMLVDVVRGASVEIELLLPTHLVVRRSCGCAGPSTGSGGGGA